ncbi:hypothetical protein NUU61_009299 [Penicillium alfredii]|uniref:DnaJ homologue subfamily C member 28 conserved domain-containing protein n=1 Tax=Penicillium alfredii TaxID=1506179 RepID=A0A9W9JX50_9EURO|nr:uncharacterized protein NUU61_009299 [Penicillium alfredii]KAJ5084720.1 hypothetical protein NUU61_009299 [Penicillium alfredii]
MTGRCIYISQLRNASSLHPRRALIAPARRFSACPRTQTASSSPPKTEEKDNTKNSNDDEKEGGMTRRLAQMTEDAMLEGGRSARRNMEHAGFSEELKKQLEERVAAASFKSDHAAAHSVVDMPASAGQGSRDIAAAPAWTGTESFRDSALRMLDDASKPIRTPYKIPQPVNLQPAPKPKRSPGERIAEAKERTSTYTLSQSPGFSEEERETMRREMREKLTPGAHSMPISIQGLSSLANERIEDAIARGQFKRIRRGKGVNVETDQNANSAFIDTTAYFMNKMIQKQEIVPPWIEKQQELAAETSRFRQRLRAEWRRHAARLIASKGGSLDAQMKLAKAFAAAERRLVEKTKFEASMRGGNSAAPDEATASEINQDGRIVSQAGRRDEPAEAESGHEDSLPHLPPLRDPSHFAMERSFHELAVKHLNTLTRSYNLQAPPAAHKPYVNLDRELNSCFADVAPSLAEEIRRRATERARSPSPTVPPPSASVLGSFGTGSSVRVSEEDQSKGYGFKEFWRDLFSK